VDRLSREGKLMEDALAFAKEVYSKGQHRRAYQAIKETMYEEQINTCYYKSSAGYKFDAKPKAKL
jgi:hypothetical protein